MAPHSPGTDQIDTLFWIGTVAAAIFAIAVIGGLLYVLRRYRAERGAEPRQVTGGRRIQLRVGATLGVLAAALLVVSIVYTQRAAERPITDATGLQVGHYDSLKITATGQQWLWRYDYPNEAFSYYKLVVPANTSIELDLVSTDVIHTWDVPDLAPKRDAVPGKVNRVYFKADEEGIYRGQAATMSGQAYAPMRTEVEVVPVQKYREFVAAQKEQIQEAQDRVVRLIENGETP